MLEQLTARAFSLGFARMAVLPPEGTPVEHTHPHNRQLVEDPQRILPGAKALLLLVWPYRPYRPRSGQVELDAYYPASNAAHQATRALAEWIREQGYAADMRALLRLKPLSRRAGLGSPGRNSLIAVDNLGSWVSLQMILTDAPLPFDRAAPAPDLSPECAHCGACLRACPTGALDGTGRVDLTRCLRAQPEDGPIPEPLREKLGGSLLGCNLCQACCPRNRQVEPAEMPREVEDALRLPALLTDGHKALAPLIGSNFARRMRVNARAALLCANLGRRDLLPLLRPLAGSESDMVRQHALWAINKLT